MSDQLIVERAALAKKEKGELQAIVSALGGSSSARDRKVDLIDQILELAGATGPGNDGSGGDASPDGDGGGGRSGDAGATGDVGASDGAPSRTDAASSDAASSDAASSDGASGGDASSEETDSDTGQQKAGSGSGGRTQRASNGSKASGGSSQEHPVGPDGEPLADWELEVIADSQQGSGNQGEQSRSERQGDRKSNESREDADPNNRRNRRRGRSRGRDRDDAGNEPISSEPVPVAGYLDLRDEGYGFLRVNGNLPSKEDVYVSVKQVRQYGLRKGDHLTGLSRPANRNEKNPGFHQIDSVNGDAPEEARNRVRFEDLTPLFPDVRLVMEMRDEPLNITTRIIDLVAPIGKGQRGLIVAPPKAGKTSVIKDIARAIETNNPEVHLMVLLVDERPEEVTDMRRHLTNGEVAASTFDRPPEEHCAVAELTIERAKRLVEAGEDVCIILDGITRLARAYNLSVPQTGRAMSGGIDAGALYPAKRFFGAARNLEDGGSLTMLATALVETGSKMDEVIFEEFKGTGNMELRLDRRLAEKRIFPAIDMDASSTRHEELLFDRQEKQASWELRRGLSALSSDGNPAGAVEALVDKLKTFKTNRDFIDGIIKAPSL